MLPYIKKSLIFMMLVFLASCNNATPAPGQTSPPNTPIPATVPPTTQVVVQSSATPSPITPTVTNPPSTSTTSSTVQTAPAVSTSQLSTKLPIGYAHMFDANNGWAVHDSSTPQKAGDILVTSSGGSSWEIASPPLSEGYYQGPAVSFSDNKNGIAVYIYYKELSPIPTDIRTWRTADGGRTWQPGEILKIKDGLGLIFAKQVIMDTPNHAWLYLASNNAGAAAPVTLYGTQDGGAHWDLIYTTSESNASSQDELWDQFTSFGGPQLVFFTPTDGYFSSAGLFVTHDGGHSWHRQTLPAPADIPDLESQSGLISTFSTPQFSSAKDGVFIRRVYPLDQINSLGDYSILPRGEYIYLTHDGGKTWESQSSPAKIGTLFFLDAQLGWYVGKPDADPKSLPLVYQTQDSGQHWTNLNSKNAPPLGSEIQFVDKQNGFAITLLGNYNRTFDARAGNEPQLYIAKDGGINWETIDFKIAP